MAALLPFWCQSSRRQSEGEWYLGSLMRCASVIGWRRVLHRCVYLLARLAIQRPGCKNGKQVLVFRAQGFEIARPFSTSWKPSAGRTLSCPVTSLEAQLWVLRVRMEHVAGGMVGYLLRVLFGCTEGARAQSLLPVTSVTRAARKAPHEDSPGRLADSFGMFRFAKRDFT